MLQQVDHQNIIKCFDSWIEKAQGSSAGEAGGAAEEREERERARAEGLARGQGGREAQHSI